MAEKESYLLDLDDPNLMKLLRRAWRGLASEEFKQYWFKTPGGFCLAYCLRSALLYNATCVRIYRDADCECYRVWCWIPVSRHYRPKAPAPPPEFDDLLDTLTWCDWPRGRGRVGGAYPMNYHHDPLPVSRAGKFAWVEMWPEETKTGIELLRAVRMFCRMSARSSLGKCLIRWRKAIRPMLAEISGTQCATLAVLPPLVDAHAAEA